jgi:hypothetical protein
MLMPHNRFSMSLTELEKWAGRAGNFVRDVSFHMNQQVVLAEEGLVANEALQLK